MTVATRAPSLLTIVRRALGGECRLPPGANVLAAVSGGPDSMALLSCLVRVAPRFSVSVRAHGVDHGLRPDAAAELDLAARFCEEHGVPFRRSTVTVTRGGNLQARARDARWAALREAASAEDAVIATAHHAEDRAETVLMRILRGAGARGLAVLPPLTSARAQGPTEGAAEADGQGDKGSRKEESVGVVRPLLRAHRSEVMAHLARHGVPYATDPSNRDPRYLRTRVRGEVLPLLQALDPAIVSHLCAIADDLEGTATARPAAWTAGLPRSTQTAIAELVRSRSATARVWLPDGLLLMAEPRTRREE